jgi:hypothetical protein
LILPEDLKIIKFVKVKKLSPLEVKVKMHAEYIALMSQHSQVPIRNISAVSMKTMENQIHLVFVIFSKVPMSKELNMIILLYAFLQVIVVQ